MTRFSARPASVETGFPGVEPRRRGSTRSGGAAAEGSGATRSRGSGSTAGLASAWTGNGPETAHERTESRRTRRGGAMAPDTTGELGDLLGIWAHPDDEAYLSAGLMMK